jgi:hypothetical protein
VMCLGLLRTLGGGKNPDIPRPQPSSTPGTMK